MNVISEIKNLSNGNSSIKSNLTYGYTRKQTIKTLCQLLRENPLEKSISKIIFRRIIEFTDKSGDKNNSTIEELGEIFLAKIKESRKYSDRQFYGYYLNKISVQCSFELAKSINTYFLRSGRSYLREYAYKQNLEKLGLYSIVFDINNSTVKEQKILLNQVVYHYSSDFIEKHFEYLITHSLIEEYHIRKIFQRLIYVSEEKLSWLELNYPSTFIYFVNINNIQISDKECYKISNRIINKVAYCDLNSHMIPDEVQFLFWNLAGMQKWNVIRKIKLNDQKKNLSDLEN